MNTEELAAALAQHEAVCAERWKTVFNQLKDMDGEFERRCDVVESSITRIETIIIGVAGTIIVGLLGIVGTLVTIH